MHVTFSSSVTFGKCTSGTRNVNWRKTWKIVSEENLLMHINSIFRREWEKSFGLGGGGFNLSRNNENVAVWLKFVAEINFYLIDVRDCS
jgi:hypothetical protein